LIELDWKVLQINTNMLFLEAMRLSKKNKNNIMDLDSLLWAEALRMIFSNSKFNTPHSKGSIL
jgi:hypothetical protein